MEMVEIFTRPDDLHKLRKRVAALRPPGLIRRQVARNNVWTNISSIRCWRVGGWLGTRRKPTDRGAWGHGRTEVRASGQVGRRVDHLRLPKVGVTAIGEIEVWGTA